MLEIHNKFFMNTSLYLPDELAKRLEKYVKTLQSGSSRNKVIALAVEEFLDRQDTASQWSRDVLEWQGVAGFELDRSEGLLDEDDFDVFA